MCPQCRAERAQQPQLCEQGHRYVTLPPADRHGVSPLWLAVQLLEDESARLRHLADGADTHDVVCRLCGDRARMDPSDAFVPQVKVFLDLHRHPPGAPGPRWAPPGRVRRERGRARF